MPEAGSSAFRIASKNDLLTITVQDLKLSRYEGWHWCGLRAGFGSRPISLRSYMTVESAVAIAGGFSSRARHDGVTLTHTDSSGSFRNVVPLGTAVSPSH